jgi:DNA-binding CsgD family transcriptional regulator
MKLSKKQQGVYDWAVKGLSNKHIAQRLGVAESTVKMHLTAIFKAYGVRTRTQLICAVNAGLTPDDVRRTLPQNAKPCGWAKTKNGAITGVVFGKVPPGDEWVALYIG